MKAPHQIIDLFPTPAFLFDKNNFEIIHSNQKGLVLTQLDEMSIKSFKISNFIDKNFLKVGDFENCCFKINAQAFTIGNLTVQSLDKEYLIVSFCSNTKVAFNSKSLIDLSPDSIFIMQDGIIQYANPKLLSVSGYKLCELIGEKFTKFVSEGELGKVYSIFTAREKGENTPIEYESKAKLSNGNLIDVDVSVFSILFEEKPAYQVYLRDITKRKIAESQYRNIIDFAPIGFYQSLRDGSIILANNELANILGFENNEELISKNISDFYFSIEEREQAINKYDTATKSEINNVEIKFRKKDGSPIWVLMTARAIKDKNLNTISYDGFLIDITARKMKESIQKLLINLSKKSFQNIVLKDYLELMHNELKEIMIADNFYIALYDKTTDKYRFPYGVESFGNYNSDSLTDLHNTLIDFVRESKQGMLVTEKNRNEIYKKTN